MQVLLSAAAFSVLLLAVIAAYYVVRQVSVAVDETAEMPAAGSVELGGGETTRSDADTTTEQSERSGSSGSSS
jgi:hypothetical protein